MTQILTHREPVLIAGGGPVGLTLAALLSRRGVRVARRRGRRRLLHRQPRDLRLATIAWRSSAGSAPTAACADIGLPWVGGRSYFRDTEVLHFRDAERPERTLRADGEHPAVRRRGSGASRRWRTGSATCAGRRRVTDAAPGRARRRRATVVDASTAPPSTSSSRLAGRLRRRPQHGARAARPGARRHPVRRPLRDRRHRAGDRTRRRAPRLVRSAVEPGLDDPDASAARRRLAHRLPDRATTRTRRGGPARQRAAARREPPRDDRRGPRRGSRCGSRSTTRSA